LLAFLFTQYNPGGRSGHPAPSIITLYYASRY